MKIVNIHYKVSKPVSSFKEIKAEVALMERFIVRGQFKGYYNKAFAIAHCQVSETPYAFFVVAPECVDEKMFKAQIIINPEIVEAPLNKEITQTNGTKITIPNAIEYQEPCMSFPYRQPKRVDRYDVIKVKYQIPSLFGLKTITTQLSGIASEIFQHEFDHLQGKNIYFESETPVKWWELIGTAKSKGGTSLDNPENLELKRAKEKPTKPLTK
ncbi:MAG: peptide deformylase [Lutibacter sp.]|jgi:peptide deformylase